MITIPGGEVPFDCFCLGHAGAGKHLEVLLVWI